MIRKRLNQMGIIEKVYVIKRANYVYGFYIPRGLIFYIFLFLNDTKNL
jgi:hypothetical protein